MCAGIETALGMSDKPLVLGRDKSILVTCMLGIKRKVGVLGKNDDALKACITHAAGSIVKSCRIELYTHTLRAKESFDLIGVIGKVVRDILLASYK